MLSKFVIGSIFVELSLSVEFVIIIKSEVDAFELKTSVSMISLPFVSLLLSDGPRVVSCSVVDVEISVDVRLLRLYRLRINFLGVVNDSSLDCSCATNIL